MKRLLQLLLSARTLALLGLLLLGAFVWFSAWPMLLRLAVTAGLLSLALLYWLVHHSWRRWHGRRAAAGLEQALEGSMASAAGTGADQREVEENELRSQLREAIRTLKSSRLGRRSGQAALYELPWLMLIGASSTGKSTAVVQSGLTFPFPHGKDNVLHGIGGTRHCDWFFTSEGILLDTAGRYAVEAEHREAWMSFLRLLKRHRPKAPINGILVTASVAQLRDAPAQDVITLARDLRARVQELTDALEVSAPVYVLFTKADLISGFTGFFAGHDAQDREQVWGATLPYERKPAADAVALFDQHFAELREGLKETALAHMTLHRGQALPPSVLAFPLEFAALQPALRSFVATLFDENVYQVRPVFRGFYFSSAVQPGDAAAAPADGVAQQFGLSPAAGKAAPAQAMQQGYFLKRLFSDVIFADRDLVRQRAHPTQRRLRAVGYALGVLTLSVALGGWTWSYLGNRQLVAGVQADLEKAQRLQEGRADLASRLQALELLQARVDELAAWRAQRPWTVDLGLYQGEALERRLRREVFQGLRRVMLEPVAQALEGYLGEVNLHAAELRPSARGTDAQATAAAATPVPAAAASRYAQASPTDVEEAYNALKTYLMLAERQRMESGHLADQVTRFWRGWLEDNRGTLPREQLMRSAESLISFAMAHLQDPLFPVIANNFGLVDRTRENLRRVVRGMPAIERVYADMKARAATRYAPITVARIVGEQDKALIAGSHVVGGAFTREAWLGHVEGAIRDAAHNELQSSDWVLKTSTHDDLSLQGSPQHIRKTLVDLYKAEYVREWQRFMQGVAVADFAGFDAAVAHMNRLGDPADSPLRKLLLTLHEQTAWDNPSLADAHAARAREGVAQWLRQSLQQLSPAQVEVKADTAPSEPLPMGAVGREFAALERLLAAREGAAPLLEGYLQSLGRVRSRLNTMKNQGDAGPAARQLMAATFEGGASELAEALRFVDEQLLAGASDGVKAALRPLLVRPLMSSFAALVPAAEAELNRQWTAQVLQPFQLTLAGKYPFDPASRVEAAPAEIARVFGPSGAVARFATEALGPLVTRRGDEVAARQWAQLGLRLRPAFAQGLPGWVAPLDSAAAPSAGAAQVSFQLRPTGAPGFVEYTVDIDGQVLRYRNGEASWSSFVWPRPGATPGVRISGIALDGQAVEVFNAPGAYGFERLIDAAQVTKLADGLRELTLGQGPLAVTLHYRAISTPGPLAGGAATAGGAGLRGLLLPGLVAGEDAAQVALAATAPAAIAATATGAAR